MAGQRPADPVVLLIDDDLMLLDSLGQGLSDLGLKVEGVSTSIEALMQLGDLEPTCIVLDLRMPGVEGLDLLNALCSSKRHMIIVLSGFVDVQTAVEAMRMGAHDVLQKPAPLEVVYGAVTKALALLADRQVPEDLTFTRRERQVAEHLVQGLTAKQIALKLELSPRTVEFFRSNLMR